MVTPRARSLALFVAILPAAALGLPAHAQTTTTQPAPAATQPAATLPSATQPAASQPAPAAASQPASEQPYSFEPIRVTAEKREENAQDVPESLTAISLDTLRNANITEIRQAADYAPDVVMSHFSNRRLSFPFFRGVGSGRNSPGVTTNYDGVPQLSYATSNLEFIDVQSVEFVRGPQGALYGRNTIGGVININSRPPSNQFFFESTSTAGNYHYLDERATVNVPLVKDLVAISFSGGANGRDGYTKNDVTGHDIDSKEAEFGKLQFFFTPAENLDITLRIFGEHDRDGDYPLGDLAAMRANPYHVSHDYEGDSLRDFAGFSLTANYYTHYATFTSITALENWRSQDKTDLDYTSADLIRRQSREIENDFTQEFRAASPTDAPVVLTPDAHLAWVAGVFFFSSNDDQHFGDEYRPGSVGVIPGIPFPFTSYNDANLDNLGASVFGQTTLTLYDKLDLITGLRFDTEHHDAGLNNYASSTLIPGSSQNPSANYNDVSARFGLAYHWTKDLQTYATAAQAYKAGGFNATAPVGKTAFGPENAWTYEAGLKSSWLKNRLTANLAYFYTDWRSLQLDVPTGSPFVYYIDNVGHAHSQGIELELHARPVDDLELFAGLGYMQSQFDSYIQPSGVSAHGNDLPFAPDLTWNAGFEYSRKLCSQATAFFRAEEVGVGRYFYDASNAAASGAYAMTDLRVGLRGQHWRVEGYVNNLFDTHTIPMAIPYPLAPSGYVGEPGDPRTYGISVTIDF